MFLSIKMIILATNSDGSAEFHTCVPEVTQAQHDRGEHHALAKENARLNGFVEPMMSRSERDIG